MSEIQWRPGKPRKEKAEPKESVYPICQTVFSGSRRKYCSDKCREAAKRQREQKTIRNMRSVRLVGRKCHDCGKPTTDYRCPACWNKRRHVEPNNHMTDGDYVFV